MIDIGKWGRQMEICPASGPSTIGFGVDPKNAAVGLRELADKIERGEIDVLSVQTGQRVEPDHWAAVCLFIELAHYRPAEGQRKPPERIVKLSGPDR